MAKHIPYIISENARAQAEFYTQALGGEINSVMTLGQAPGTPETDEDKVIHLCLTAAGITFFLSDAMEGPVSPGNAVNHCLEFAAESEARAAFDKLAVGGRVHQPLEPAFWGALYGQLEDRFGIQWMITTANDCQAGA